MPILVKFIAFFFEVRIVLSIRCIWAGADLLINLSTEDPDDPWYAREYVFDRFLSVDDEFSIYHFIRKVTNNNSYTMANIASLSN